MGGLWLWWIGEGQIEREAMEHVRLHVERAFRVPAAVWAGQARPQGTLDVRRKQHASGRMLEWLLREGPGEGRVLGMTDVDLFIPILTFVFGEAQLNGRAAVVSTARLSEPVLVDRRVLWERLAKEAVHELGHALGLTHCSRPECAMSRSAGLRDVDRKGGQLCADCRTLLDQAQDREPRT
ncbi:MAG: archaemetzincin family Zn-dependent metalloprotease [Deltaproteobacteria bacterium]|nr:archaemetzincin family Zn-dependent metalloprotease [Deltaproteobacteria bacterium]